MTHVEQINHIGVVGAGTMGSGIVQVAAQAGFDVTMYDIEDEILTNAVERIGHFINRGAEKGRITREAADAAVARISTTTDLADFAPCDFVVEAAPEHLDLKRQIFGDLDDITRDEVILATNTSTLSVTQIATATERADLVVGMHFFNPPALMPLVEVAAGEATAGNTVDTTVAIAEKMGKSPVRTKDVPGFIVNRVARPFYLEGLRLRNEGVADHKTIDTLIREGGGFRMGPFELMDLIGLDINFTASKTVYEAYYHEPRYRPSLLQQRMVESGRLGRKSGRGWYTYDEAEEDT